MQTILSRAGKAPRSGCKACTNAVETLGKRPVTARRRPTFAELFTACYSSVFATAALVDAVKKDDRRKELDRQLEEVRKELVDLQNGRQRPGSDDNSKASELSLRQMVTLWQSLKMIYNSRPYMKEIHQPATIGASDLIEALKHEHYGCSNDPLLNSKRQMNYDRLEGAIMQEESEKGKYYRESRTQVQLLRESWSTETLIRKLLDRTRFLPTDQSGPSVQTAWTLLERGSPEFTFRSIDSARAQHNTILLNNSLRALAAASNLSMKEKVGRICYNLLVSSHPPDIHTYNTLIVAFNKSGHHSFAEALVASFFQYRLLQPTPSTFIAILNHYQCTNNHGRFLRALACITGLDSRTGAKVRRRHILDIEENPNLLPWALDSGRRTLTGGWIWDHLPLSRHLVEEIIGGLLHFKLFDQAAAFFLSSMQCGVNLSFDSVKYFLDECINALDWKAAVRLTSSLARSQPILQRLLRVGGDGESASYIVGRVRVLLDICGLGGSDKPPKSLLVNLKISGPYFTKFLNTLAQEAGPPQERSISDQESYRSRSRLLQLESIWKEYEFVRKTTLSIESKLLYPDFSHTFRASMAFHIGKTATQRSERLDQELKQLLSSSVSIGSTPRSPSESEDVMKHSFAPLDAAPLPEEDAHTKSETPFTGDVETSELLDHGNTVETKFMGSRSRQIIATWTSCLLSEGSVFRRVAMVYKRMMRTEG